MISSIISTILLTINVLGLKIPSTILNENQIKKANESTSEVETIEILSWDQTNAIKQYNSTEIYCETTESDYPKRKDCQQSFYVEKNNNFINIRDSSYGNARYRQELEGTSWKFVTGIQNSTPTSVLNITELTAYQGLAQTKISIDYTINVPYTYGQQRNVYKIRTYASSNPNFANFIKVANWNIYDYPRTTFNRIRNDFYYSLEKKRETTVECTTINGHTQDFINWKCYVNIEPGVTNYLISYVEMLTTEVTSYGTSSQDPSVWVWNPGTKTITGIVLGNINYEVVNIPDIMFNVLTMPFAFISQAFNLTLFPGTPYAVNIGNLLLIIIGVAIMITLLKIIAGAVKK